MIINGGNLRSLWTGFSTAYREGLGVMAPTWDNVAMAVPSTTRTQEYGWLGQLPQVREWIGERQIQNLRLYDYAIRNRAFELTIGVEREDIEDDNLGIFSPMFTNMGRAVASFPDSLLWPLMNNGFSSLCYDGQNYFDVDHPVIDANGNTVSVSNCVPGLGGVPWFLIDDTQGFKPLIWQTRKPFEMVRMDNPTDEQVFSQKTFRYGVDGRCNAGYGFWQIAFGSTDVLSAASYGVARQAMLAMKGDGGRPLGLRPSLLVVPPSLEYPALELLNAERNAAGATNVYAKTARLLISPWLQQ